MGGRDKVTGVMVRVVFLEAMSQLFFFYSFQSSLWSEVMKEGHKQSHTDYYLQ